MKQFLGLLGLATLAVAVWMSRPAPTTAAVERGDPGASLTYEISLNGTGGIVLDSCTNIGSRSDVITFTDGSNPDLIRKLAGRVNYLDIECQRGLTSSFDLVDWRRLVEEGDISGARRSLTITVYDATLTPIAQWNGLEAWPAALVVTDEGRGVPTERLTIVLESLDRVSL